MEDGRWQIEKFKSSPFRVAMYMNASVSGNTITLFWNAKYTTPYGYTIQRRIAGNLQWDSTAPGWLEVKDHSDSFYPDSTVSPEIPYEYRVFPQEASSGGPYAGESFHIMAGINLPVKEHRGSVIVLVDETLESDLASEINQLKEDLIGDGWTPIIETAPRHDDSIWSNNPSGIATVKNRIRELYLQDPSNIKSVILIGHVAIPHSGIESSDGHSCIQGPPDHRGAWPADMYYLDVENVKSWGDSLTLENCDYAQLSNYPGDGKWDLNEFPINTFPSPWVHFPMKLAIGRIDFARMPVFASNFPPGANVELELLKRYFAKNHKYRHGLLSWQGTSHVDYDRALVYGHFHDSDGGNSSGMLYHTGFWGAAAFFGNVDDARFRVGDTFFQRQKPHLWGFLSGPGWWTGMNGQWPERAHSSLDLTNPANEPTCAFYTMHGSYFGDWNTVEDNFLRSVLATPNYGLASLWLGVPDIPIWRLDIVSLGEPLGSALTQMANVPRKNSGNGNRRRELTILGDPTLRINVIPSPRNFSATYSSGQVLNSWTPVNGSTYYVYRATNQNGPYTRITPMPISGGTFTDTQPYGSGQKYYMVRALQTVTTGNGSYGNISQGSLDDAN